MLQQLKMLEQANRADSVMRNDSLAEDLVAYFDKNGTPNERMRAYYILGRTYADLGEAPKAIAAYQSAEGCADTTHDDCDFKTLSRIHGQKAGIFRKQYMAQEAVTEFDKAIKYSLAANDSLSTLRFIENRAIAYYQLGLYDSLLISTDIVFNGYKLRGLYELAANSIGASIRILLQRNDVKKAKRYIDFYEQNCDLKKDPANKKAALYTYLGSYHLCSGCPDSAVLYFKKQLEYKEILNNRVQGYHGLFRAYQQMNQKDSMAKYADLYCIANDSSNVFESANRLQRIQSMYRYERSQKEAELNRKRAEDNRRFVWWSVCTALFILIIVIQRYRKILSEDKNQMKALNQEYNNIREAYNKAQKDLVLLEKEKAEFILLKEGEVVHYKNLLQKYETFTRMEDEQGSIISDNPLLNRLHKIASSGKTLKDDDIEEVFALINRVYPHFFSELKLLSGRLTYKQKSVCGLTKLYFIPSEIGSLLNMRYQAVTNMRSRMAKVLFGEESKTEDFDIKIHEIC